MPTLRLETATIGIGPGGFSSIPEVKPLVSMVKGNTFEVVERKGHYLWLKPLEMKGKGMTPLGNIEGGLLTTAMGYFRK